MYGARGWGTCGWGTWNGHVPAARGHGVRDGAKREGRVGRSIGAVKIR